VKDVPEVLFVCVHNAGRSQMAAALLDHHGRRRVRVVSAGSEPADEVAETAQRLEASGLLPTRDDGVCCYADQSKVWVDGPDGKPWEVYAVLADVDEPAPATPCC